MSAPDSMVERVARALAMAAGFDPDQRITQVQPYSANGDFRWFWTDANCGLQQPAWMFFERNARAVLVAMREPTEAFLEKLADAGVFFDEPSWQGTIDVALKE